MKYIKLKKEKIKSLIKSLFTFGKKEILFLLIVNIILFLGIFYGKIILTIPSISSFIIVLIVILIYKHLTKCSEFDLFKVLFQWILTITIISLFFLINILSFSESPFLLFLSLLFKDISFIITSSIAAIGLVYLLYSKKVDLKELFVLIIISIIVIIASSLHDLYYNGFILSKVLTIEMINGILGGLLIVYGFKKLKRYILGKHKELTFFISLALIIFILEYLNGLLAIPSSVPKVDVDMFGLFLLNFEFFVFYSLFGILLHIYYKLRKKEINFF